jgi:hypothetical protein
MFVKSAQKRTFPNGDTMHRRLAKDLTQWMGQQKPNLTPVEFADLIGQKYSSFRSWLSQGKWPRHVLDKIAQRTSLFKGADEACKKYCLQLTGHTRMVDPHEQLRRVILKATREETSFPSNKFSDDEIKVIATCALSQELVENDYNLLKNEITGSACWIISYNVGDGETRADIQNSADNRLFDEVFLKLLVDFLGDTKQGKDHIFHIILAGFFDHPLAPSCEARVTDEIAPLRARLNSSNSRSKSARSRFIDTYGQPPPLAEVLEQCQRIYFNKVIAKEAESYKAQILKQCRTLSPQKYNERIFQERLNIHCHYVRTDMAGGDRWLHLHQDKSATRGWSVVYDDTIRQKLGPRDQKWKWSTLMAKLSKDEVQSTLDRHGLNVYEGRWVVSRRESPSQISCLKHSKS